MLLTTVNKLPLILRPRVQEGRDVLQRIALLAIAAPRRVIAVAVLVMLAAGIFGVPVAKSLSSSGFRTRPPSRRGRQLLTTSPPGRYADADLVTTPDGATGPAARAVGLGIVDQLKRSPNVAEVTSAWTAPPAAARAGQPGRQDHTGRRGHQWQESVAQATAQTLSGEVTRDHPAGTTGVIVRSGGDAMVNAQINSRLRRDLLLMESIAVPLSFLVLVWVFGGLLAAALPVAVGLLAILGSMAVLRFITFSTDVSNLAPNLTTAMGSPWRSTTRADRQRYRDELAGHRPNTALVRTMTTGAHGAVLGDDGRVVDGALVLFPMHVLKSFAYAGVATVAFAALAAVVVTPAAICCPGDRLNAWMSDAWLSACCTGPTRPRSVEAQFWYRSTTFVMLRRSTYRCRIAPGAKRTLPWREMGLPR